MREQLLVELIEDYPKISVRELDIEILVEIADRWLRVEYSKRRRMTARSFERGSQRVDIIDAGISNAINRISRDAAARIVNEWSPSLLAQSFSLSGGRSVQWGDASVRDHEERATQLEKHASGELQTAALHRRAAEDIRHDGTSSLRGLAAA